jgi:hypothetical protein
VSITDSYYCTNQDFTVLQQERVILKELSKMLPGRFYRTSLKLCVENLCFPPVKSNGFIVLHSYPKIGTLFINIGEQQVYLVFRELLFISKK